MMPNRRIILADNQAAMRERMKARESKQRSKRMKAAIKRVASKRGEIRYWPDGRPIRPIGCGIGSEMRQKWCEAYEAWIAGGMKPRTAIAAPDVVCDVPIEYDDDGRPIKPAGYERGCKESYSNDPIWRKYWQALELFYQAESERWKAEQQKRIL